ncbi:gamma-taxilin-like isoform X2 [Rhopilema esculentum]|uniref:gamma-taxilin-like isoform X2 n=1 Tax=Rhopilema esculentum TaxID=499914 RepID=UPI0031D0750E|eukprot:gene17798-9477_t
MEASNVQNESLASTNLGQGPTGPNPEKVVVESKGCDQKNMDRLTTEQEEKLKTVGEGTEHGQQQEQQTLSQKDDRVSPVDEQTNTCASSNLENKTEVKEKRQEPVNENMNQSADIVEKEEKVVENTTKELINGELATSENTSPVLSPSHKADAPVAVAEDKSIQTQNGDPVQSKKTKKKDKSSAEEKKLVDLLVHVFDGLETPEKKMEALAKKYIQLAADMKSTESKLDDVEAKHKETKREKEQLQMDFGKVNMAKTKLESLCRELQKQNKVIKEEIQRRADEEDRKRRELSQKFQSTINDITTQMGENHKRNQQLKQDNTDLAQKLKGLVEQYAVREQHIEKVLKAKQLELQLCEAKLQQQTQILQEERQNNMKEKHVLLQDSLEQKKKVEMLLKQEAELKGQLTLYTDKFVEFQSTLTKSNEVFATFKKEMDKMTKTIRKLEKESNTWKTRYENTNVSLIQMVEERTQKDNDILAQKGKIEKLEKLCRALQAERRKLMKEVDQQGKVKASDIKESNDADGEKSCNSTPEPPEIGVGDVTHDNADAREVADQACDGSHVPLEGETVASTPITEVSVDVQ